MLRVPLWKDSRWHTSLVPAIPTKKNKYIKCWWSFGLYLQTSFGWALSCGVGGTTYEGGDVPYCQIWRFEFDFIAFIHYKCCSRIQFIGKCLNNRNSIYWAMWPLKYIKISANFGFGKSTPTLLCRSFFFFPFKWKLDFSFGIERGSGSQNSLCILVVKFH